MSHGSGLRPGVLFGRYMPIERLAKGGMGEVFLAIAPGPNASVRPCVIKLLLDEFSEDEERIHRFIEEARVLVSLEHRNVVQILEFGKVAEDYFIAMEYVDGTSVGQLLSAMGALPPGVAMFIAREMMAGLTCAHTLVDLAGNPVELVHRDISPSNVLVSRAGEVKVADFGLARRRSNQKVTARRVLLGKLNYMAPELLRLEPASVLSDLYAAGICLHEMLTGRSLFTAAEMRPKLSRMISTPPVAPPSLHNPEVSPGLDAICLKALAADPAHRYVSCAEMRRAIDGELEALGIRLEPLPTALAGLIRALQLPDRGARLEEVLGRSGRAQRKGPGQGLPEPPESSSPSHETFALAGDVLLNPSDLGMVETGSFVESASQVGSGPPELPGDSNRIDPPSTPVEHRSTIPFFMVMHEQMLAAVPRTPPPRPRASAAERAGRASSSTLDAPLPAEAALEDAPTAVPAQLAPPLHDALTARIQRDTGLAVAAGLGAGGRKLLLPATASHPGFGPTVHVDAALDAADRPPPTPTPTLPPPATRASSAAAPGALPLAETSEQREGAAAGLEDALGPLTPLRPLTLLERQAAGVAVAVAALLTIVSVWAGWRGAQRPEPMGRASSNASLARFDASRKLSQRFLGIDDSPELLRLYSRGLAAETEGRTAEAREHFVALEELAASVPIDRALLTRKRARLEQLRRRISVGKTADPAETQLLAEADEALAAGQLERANRQLENVLRLLVTPD